MLPEQGAAVFDRVLAGRVCQLVDQALHHERVWVCPTERHHSTGMPVCGECSST